MAGATWTTKGVFTGRGGVRTDGTGIMTGDLTVRTTWDGGQADVSVRYTDTAQWFALAGSPVPCRSEQDSRQLHQAVVEAVRAGGGTAVPQPARRGGWF
ncbi:hypothetical protein [Streptomyces sp. NEAU-W12]|uniref:hypothetical protein n=1 Tax=Streptomyces sp. NEAU-W12 TaxID=2994668 RepID=UPI00224A511E|nr:hypothetical protein [Streptomyces sp. NEAU-W12]MCX2925586.1 hypothetical protein [Streptomyces sp. NEAU-W12]